MSMRMNLPKALKIKNRLAGDMTRLQALIKRDNSVEQHFTEESSRVVIDAASEKHTTEVAKFLGDLESTRAMLVAIKAAISCANAGVYERIVTMNEAKSEIAFWREVPVQNGHSIEERYGGTPVKHLHHAAFDQAYVDARLKELQTKVDALQDEIDEYNASTFITI